MHDGRKSRKTTGTKCCANHRGQDLINYVFRSRHVERAEFRQGAPLRLDHCARHSDRQMIEPFRECQVMFCHPVVKIHISRIDQEAPILALDAHATAFLKEQHVEIRLTLAKDRRFSHGLMCAGTQARNGETIVLKLRELSLQPGIRVGETFHPNQVRTDRLAPIGQAAVPRNGPGVDMGFHFPWGPQLWLTAR